MLGSGSGSLVRPCTPARGWNSTSRLTHMAVGNRPQLFAFGSIHRAALDMASARDCVCVVCEREREPKIEVASFYNPISEMIPHPFIHIPFISNKPLSPLQLKERVIKLIS